MVDSVLPSATSASPSSSPSPAVVTSPATAETAEAVTRLAEAGVTTIETTLVSTSGQPRATARLALPDGSFLDLKIPPGFSASPGAALTFQFQQQNGGGFVLRLAAVNGRATAGTPTATLTTANGGGLPPLLLAQPTPNPGGGLSSAGGIAGQRAGTGTAGLTASTPAPGLLADGLPGLTAIVLRPGLAPQPGGASGAFPSAGPPLSPGQNPASFPPSLPAGAAPPTANAPGTLPAAWSTLAPGTQLPLRLAEARPADGGNAPAAPSLLTANPALAPTGGGLPPGAGSGLSLASPTPTAPLILTGRVLTNSVPGGGALVQTEVGLLSLPSGLALPVGGTVRLEVVGPPLPPPPAPPPLAPGLGTGGWPAMSEAIDQLARSDLQAANTLMQALPQAGPRLAAALAGFAAAVRNGDSRLPGGEATQRGLDKIGRHDLADRLLGDMKSLAEEAAQPKGPAGEWQTLTMPFLNGAQIDPIRLHVQTSPEDSDQRRGGGGGEKRFILDIEMSRLGRIQFDGLVLRETKRFDLIVRTRQPLDTAICRDIAGIFAECAQLTGIKGGVSFQAGRAFVDLPPSPAATTTTSLMV
ncbi:hypothetical protein [Magnetospirillum fulvum]|uniref:DNA polymerase III n=1 Tax=Magnetospirillum fulvum TaxID=1082 RepID=A0A1H6I9Q9_MAGFU|nr:hypothetical protein [Magnetospirillum fulvum]SEH45462.1 hypothetical protein SAMN04244559_02414 [Magnetospirillum fulvum]